MKRIIIAVLLALPEPGVGRAAPERADIVAVFDIEASGLNLARPALEGLHTYLVGKVTGVGYQVIPRAELLKRLRAQKVKSYKSCYDQSCQIEIGRELAAQKSLSTKILRLGSDCVVTVALYDLRRAASERAGDATGGCELGSLVRSLESAVLKLSTEARPVAVAGVVDRKHCPAPGALRQGEPPPKGTSITCVDAKGQRHGAAIEWHSNGKPHLTGQYRNNRMEGLWVTWHRNGRKQREQTYRAGLLEGRTIEWDEVGNKFEVGEYRQGRKTGVWTRWIQGVLYRQETYANDDLNGLEVVWSEDGKKRYEGHHRDGQRDGPWISYSDGKVTARGSYRKGQREGIWREFSRETGQRTAEGPYRADKKEGVWTEFDWRTGEPRDTGSYKAGKRDGLWVEKDGERETRRTYRNGKLEGLYQRLVGGRVTEQVLYKEGKQVDSPRR